MKPRPEASGGTCDVHYAGAIPYWRQLTDQGAITKEILDYEYPGQGNDHHPFLVSWIPQDSRNPMLWSMRRKVSTTLAVSMATLVVALASSAYSGAVHQVMDEFGVSSEIATVGLSLFVLGFAWGPLFWAPLSEYMGRQWPFFMSFGAMTVLLAGVAAAPNIPALMVLRFLAGVAGSAPLTNAGGVISDIFPARQRGLALCLFATAPFMGPALGPIMGGFLGKAAGWRWVEGSLAGLSALLWFTMAVCVPETYAPILLRRRAQRLSRLTGKIYMTQLDLDALDTTSLKYLFGTALRRPWILLFREPIVLILSIYIAIVYGAMFMMFPAFPIVYEQQRGWNQGVCGLAFLGIMVGMLIATLYSIPDNKRYLSLLDKYNGHPPPESRLPPVLLASICIPVGLFWFAWTNSPSVHWVASIAAGVPFGFGIVLVYLGVLSYLIDSYTIFAASVLAANSVLRSSFGAIFPLFTVYMYKGLGIHWASSVPAFLALACVPFPFIFYKYGKTIRQRCKYASESEMYIRKINGDPQGSAACPDNDYQLTRLPSGLA